MPEMTAKPVWQKARKDGSGEDYTLYVMPRTDFREHGVQTGIGIHGPLIGMTVGLSDAELDSLILALQQERRRSA